MTYVDRYAWTIDVDHIADDVPAPSNNNAVGMTGPRHAPDILLKTLNAGNGIPFRMHDDDGTLYYEGRIVCTDDATMFEPLDDFGMPKAGCTTIEYRGSNGSGAWEAL